MNIKYLEVNEVRSSNRNKKMTTPVSENEIITLENVSKAYSTGAPALNGVTLHINRGEFVFIVGDSGSGKSTLIKLLLRELTPTEGNIRVMGYDLNKLRHRKIPKFRRNLGIVFQDFRLIPKMSVYDNVAFALRVIGMGERKITKRVRYVLKLVDLSDKADNLPNQLSTGERQRVAIARALVNNPGVIIADEPTGNLDPVLSGEIMSLFDKINSLGATVVVVTHDLELVRQFDHRVVTIEEGKIVSDIPSRASETKKLAEKAADETLESVSADAEENGEGGEQNG